MPHIFRFHRGTESNIYDWTVSKRIEAADLIEVGDKTIDISSSVGTSIPTPIARMFLFDTAFQIVAKQIGKPEGIDPNNIYCGLVSEVLDLLELLYMHGGNKSKLVFKDWMFESFGTSAGHKLLDESFKQAIVHKPFNGGLNITMIYYKEDGRSPVLIGGTSPFTFVFTAPNFKENLKRNGYGDIKGLVTGDTLFDNEYKALHERDAGFAAYVKYLTDKGAEKSSKSYNAIGEYVHKTDTVIKNIKKEGVEKSLENIRYGDSGLLKVSEISLSQRKAEDYKQKINEHSDFKIALEENSEYVIWEKKIKVGPQKEDETEDSYQERWKKTPIPRPLFLLDRMNYQGNYTSPTKKWSSSTRVFVEQYDEKKIQEIKERELPDDGSKYPFFSDFDFFERCLVKLPGYKLNDKKFVCVENQDFLLPLKPIFFHLFPIDKIRDYIEIETNGEKITVTLKIPVHGDGNNRIISCSKTYDAATTITYSGILGIFPFIKTDKPYLNKYTIAAFERTNVPLLVDAIDFYNKNGIETITSSPQQRTNYSDGAVKSTYYPIEEENDFSLIRLRFKPNNSECGGVIIPKFKQVNNGDVDYVYAIDFGTSNTHIEYSLISESNTANQIKPFEVVEERMLMTLLNKPLYNGTEKYNDYGKGLGEVIESAGYLTLREFMPFQFGNQRGATSEGISIKFPFRTASFEKSAKMTDKPTLFSDTNIGFYTEGDINALSGLHATGNNYQTNLKWLLETKNDALNINRVKLFFRQLLLMVRTHGLLHDRPAKIDTLKIAFSYPISMGKWKDNPLQDLLLKEFKTVFPIQNEEVKDEEYNKRIIPVTESIAPYFYLIDNDANNQNGVFCNIDIGGGTSDIVIVPMEKDNLLQPYCSSIQFAGKQLWGSGSGKDSVPESNGFLQYYKKYIFVKDPGIYTKHKNLLEGKEEGAKTEDIVSYLFSQESYKFKEVFIECKELKVPLLIHYSAILYFIAKTCKVRDIDLPRTISFSGKGSEYISSLLFSDKDELDDFTYQAFSIFSTLPVNREFETKPSREPKVITAKGAVSYAINPREVKKERIRREGDVNENSKDTNRQIQHIDIYHYGSDDPEFETGKKKYIEFRDGNDGYKKVLECNKEFLDSLFDKDANFVENCEKWLGISDFKQYKGFFLHPEDDLFTNGVLRNSFLNVIRNKKDDADANDSPFFFGLSESLIALSKTIASTQLNNIK